MKALVKNHRNLEIRELAVPEPRGPGEATIRVAVAGVCRTDLYVAEGLLPARDSLVLGHEFSGTVAIAGEGLHAGQKVAVMPIFPCGDCRECSQGAPQRCQRSSMLGVDADGAFAEFVRVPVAAVCPIPAEIDFYQAAYAEPVAAALAFTRAGLSRSARGLIIGQNRIAELCRRLMVISEFEHIDAGSGDRGDYDFAIETMADEGALSKAIEAVKPGGTVVLRSRQPRPVPIDIYKAVRKEISLRAVHYAPFSQAVELLAHPELRLHDFCRHSSELESFREVFEAAAANESDKQFFHFPSAEGAA